MQNKLYKLSHIKSDPVYFYLFAIYLYVFSATQYSTLATQYLAYLFFHIPPLLFSCFHNNIISIHPYLVPPLHRKLAEEWRVLVIIPRAFRRYRFLLWDLHIFF